MSAHLRKLMYTCPVPGCKVNLRRFTEQEDITEHFEQHSALGEHTSMAVARPPLDSRTPFPLHLTGSKPSFSLVALSVSPATFSPSSLARAKKNAAQEDENLVLFGAFLREDWLTEEAEDSPADLKERKVGSSDSPRILPSRPPLAMEIPPKLHCAPPPRHPESSVGFESQGFYLQAKAAFEAVAQQVDTDDEDEVMSSLFP